MFNDELCQEVPQFRRLGLVCSGVVLNRLRPADIVDAARGMGMSAGQVLVRVELPLALPLIIAGLRVAAVTVISVSVVAAYVNAGGLGTLIFNGIATDHPPKIWSGALAACALAIAVDTSLAALERRMRRARAG